MAYADLATSIAKSLGANQNVTAGTIYNFGDNATNDVSSTSDQTAKPNAEATAALGDIGKSLLSNPWILLIGGVVIIGGIIAYKHGAN